MAESNYTLEAQLFIPDSEFAFPTKVSDIDVELIFDAFRQQHLFSYRDSLDSLKHVEHRAMRNDNEEVVESLVQLGVGFPEFLKPRVIAYQFAFRVKESSYPLFHLMIQNEQRSIHDGILWTGSYKDFHELEHGVITMKSFEEAVYVFYQRQKDSR